MTLFRHDGAEAEALVTDRYLESLLLAGERRADDAPSDAALPPALRRAARQLSIDLVRVHPSFRFEERLAARLAEAAAAMQASESMTRTGEPLGPLPFVAGAATAAILPSSPATPAGAPGAPAPGAPAPGAPPPGAPPPVVPLSRPLIVGGALTSAVLWIAGVAYLAWRRNRSPLGPMARAARAAHAARAARAARLVQAGQAGLASLVAGSAAGLASPVATPATPAGSPAPD